MSRQQPAFSQKQDQIRINLIRDFAEHVRGWLISASEPLRYSKRAVDKVASDPYRLISWYLGVTRRLIPARPRTIHKSKEFSCPEKHKDALVQIERVTREGEPLSSYISRDILQLKNVDVMLNYLGVHHLHLGDHIDQKGSNKGFIKRTTSLLYSLFTDTDAYFIDVMDHDSFGSQMVIDIVHENWPELLYKFRMTEVKSVYPPLSAEQRFDLTCAGYSTLVTTRDGTVYMPPGGGVMYSGDNADDIREANRLCNHLHQLQTSITRFIEGSKGGEGGVPYKFPIELRLCFIDGDICAKDVKSGDIYWVAEYGVVRMRAVESDGG